MASEMIERVARAICEAEKMNPEDALGGWIHWQEAARAAIEAMREPTVEMLGASWSQTEEPLEPGDDLYGEVWRAMIDTALADPLPVHKANME